MRNRIISLPVITFCLLCMSFTWMGKTVHIPSGDDDTTALMDSLLARGDTLYTMYQDVLVITTRTENGFVVAATPYFPGGDAEFRKFISSSIQYPEEAQKAGEEGRVVCTFTVGTDGRPFNIQIRDSISPSLNEEAIRVIKSMPKWKSISARYKPWLMEYAIPFDFKLTLSTIQTEEEDADRSVFTLVDVPPEFPGGNEALLEYLKKNLRYPETAKELGVQGVVICSCIIELNGRVENVEVVRGVDPDLDKEAVRVIRNMPNWTPVRARHRGVRLQLTIPVHFRLTDE